VSALVEALRKRGATVRTGRFRARMLVESVNVGPRTLLLEV
jgi:D-tyrosyl-tRNA(Tyr) deacylase